MPPPGGGYPNYPYGPVPIAPPAPAPPATEQRWYGWQTLISDGASLLLVSMASQNRKESIQNVTFGLAAAGITLGAPIIHWSHGHVGKGFASLGIRLGMPTMGMLFLANGISGNRSDDRSILLGVLLLAAWLPTSIAVDAAVLAREEVPVSRVSLVPLVAPTHGGGTLGLGGTF